MVGTAVFRDFWQTTLGGPPQSHQVFLLVRTLRCAPQIDIAGISSDHLSSALPDASGRRLRLDEDALLTQLGDPTPLSVLDRLARLEKIVFK